MGFCVVFIIISNRHAHKQTITCTTRTPPSGTSSLILPSMIIYIFSARSDRSFNAFFIVFSSSWPLSGPCPWSRPRWLGPFAYLELGELVVWGYLGVPGTTLLHRRLSGSGKLTSCHQSILLQSCEPHANASSQFAFSFLILSHTFPTFPYFSQTSCEFFIFPPHTLSAKSKFSRAISIYF